MGPVWQYDFGDVLALRVGCSHVFGLFMRPDMTAGPDVVRENRSLSHCRAGDAQDNTTGFSARAVHSALLSHHTVVTPPTVVPRKAKLLRFCIPRLKSAPGDQAESPAGIVYSAP